MTLTYTFLVVTATVVTSVLTALLMNARFHGRAFARAAITLPYAVPEVAAVLVWTWMLSQQFGVLNVFARWVLPVSENLPWLTNTRMAMVSFLLLTLWKIFPFYSLVVLTAFQTLQAELYEAARIDGAGALACFRHITLPGIAPTLGLMTLLATIFSFRRFTVIYLLTGGGPADATKTLVVSVYETPSSSSICRTAARSAWPVSASPSPSPPPTSPPSAAWASARSEVAGRDVGAGRGPGPLRRRRPPIRLATRLALYLTVAGVCGAVLFPVYWMVLTSLRQTRDTITYPPDLLPRNVRLSAYGELLQTVPIATWLGNTVVISIGVMLLCLVLSVLGAYALSHFRWRGRSAFGFLLLVTQMLPEALLVIPIFVIFRRAGLIDTQPGLILADAAFVVPVGVWILKSYMDTIPREVREAALIDGCGPMGTLWRITLPLSVPALITVGVIAFFDGWNEYLFASTFITSSDLRPASVGLASFIGELATPVELVFAATALFTTPPVVFYFLMQRYFVSGLTSGAIKA